MGAGIKSSESYQPSGGGRENGGRKKPSEAEKRDSSGQSHATYVLMLI